MSHYVIPCVSVLLMAIAAAQEKPSYPPTRSDRAVERVHGVAVPDPYRWLEDGDTAEVKAWTEQQNAFTRQILDRLPGRSAIERKLDELLMIGRISVAEPADGRYFYTKRTGTQNQPILYVRDGVRGEDRVLIDPNTLSKDGTTAMDWWYPSEDGKLVAYGLSEGGSEESVLRVRDVAGGKDLPDVIDRTRHCSLAWTPDSTGFYYTRFPRPGSVPEGDENYHRYVFYHRLGSNPSGDPKIFEPRLKEDWPNVDLSPNGQWLVVTNEKGWSKSEVYLKDLRNDRPFVAVAQGVDAIYAPVVRDDVIYMRTNENAPRYRVFRVNPLNPARSNWVEIVSESQDVLDGLTAVGDRLVGLYMRNATSRLRLFDLHGKPQQDVVPPVLGTISAIGAEWDGSEFFFDFSSFTVPPSVYRVDLKTLQSELWEREQSDIDATDYEVHQVKYASKDGTPVTMFLAYKRGLKRDGMNPTLLTGYGGFNASETPFFGASLFLFLERGGVLAVPNLRGGGEYGEEWHKAGMLGKKQNVFDDFIAAAEWLIAGKYTNPQKLAIMGGSNGGLLVGAAVTQRPDLFRAAVCQVPLLDMVRYHKFRIARLWIPEYGDPDKPEEFRWLYAYSPYHRVKDGMTYPAMLITAAESDTRVDPMHARKTAARLQSATASSQPILVRIETKAGHGAGKPRSKTLDELTDTWSFLFWQLGITL